MNRALAALSLCCSVALTGCATSWVVDSQVNSFSRLGPGPAGATYRFDRLPSQQAQEAGQRELEAMAAPALAEAGLRPDEAAPRYAVQIGARVTTELSPWADPWFYGPGPWGPWPRAGWGMGPGYGRGWYGGGWYGASLVPPAQAWYAREVSIVMRELPGNQVVYETRARNDGPYADSRDVLPVMFRAALQGFPHPPQGDRRVDLPVGGQAGAKP